jgi:hypothetical protein
VPTYEDDTIAASARQHVYVTGGVIETNSGNKLCCAIYLEGTGTIDVSGGVLTIANFFFMAVGTALAADKAESQDVKGGKAVISASYGLRMVLLFVLMFACVKSGLCDVVALVIPLAFVRPVLTIAEFFRKKGE